MRVEDAPARWVDRAPQGWAQSHLWVAEIASRVSGSGAPKAIITGEPHLPMASRVL